MNNNEKVTDKQFKNLFTKLGLINSNVTIITLHPDFPFSNKCWKDIQDRKPENDGFWTITRPWVGCTHPDNRTLPKRKPKFSGRVQFLLTHNNILLYV